MAKPASITLGHPLADPIAELVELLSEATRDFLATWPNERDARSAVALAAGCYAGQCGGELVRVGDFPRHMLGAILENLEFHLHREALAIADQAKESAHGQ